MRPRFFSMIGVVDGGVLKIWGDAHIGDGHETEVWVFYGAFEGLGNKNLDALGELTCSSVVDHFYSLKNAARDPNTGATDSD
jgi:hypothetical protein